MLNKKRLPNDRAGVQIFQERHHFPFITGTDILDAGVRDDVSLSHDFSSWPILPASADRIAFVVQALTHPEFAACAKRVLDEWPVASGQWRPPTVSPSLR